MGPEEYNIIGQPNEFGGIFRVDINKPSGWTHVVLNYLGPNNTQGIRVYHDGVLVGNSSTKRYYFGSKAIPVTLSTGMITVGSYYGGGYPLRYYTSMQIDELVMFDGSLDQDEITMIAGKLRNYSGRSRISLVHPPICH